MSRDASGALSSRPILHEVLGRHRQRDGVADRLVEAVVGAVAEEHRQILVGALIEVVAELVVDRREVLVGRLDAHLDAQVLVEIDVPRAGVADHVAIARAARTATAPRTSSAAARSRATCRSARRCCTMSIGRRLALLQDVGQRVARVGVGRRDERIDVRPVLRPDVAEQVRRNRARRRHDVAVLLRAASSARRRAAAR